MTGLEDKPFPMGPCKCSNERTVRNSSLSTALGCLLAVDGSEILRTIIHPSTGIWTVEVLEATIFIGWFTGFTSFASQLAYHHPKS